MKILLISTQVFTVPPRGYGGLEGVVEDLAIELLKAGQVLTIVCPKGSNVPGAELIMPCDPSHNNPEGVAFEAYKQRLDEFDIVHDHSWGAYPYLWKMNHNPNLRLIHTIHSMQPWGKAPPLKYPCLVGASKYHAELISSWASVHAEYCYNGINLDTYPLCDQKDDYLLFVGRIAPFKGPHEFIALCKRLDMKGIVVGEDVYVDDQGFVHRVMDMCDGHQIIYMGRVPRGSELMVELMQGARAVVTPLLPPYGEIFGLATVEAMACGTPVISTDRGAARELIIDGETGFVVPDVFHLDQVVGKVDNISPEACRRRAEQFSREQMAKRYLELYEKVLAGEEW